MKINIKEKDIELKFTLRSMMMYENITGKTFAPEGISDILTFMYCIVVACSKDYSITFDEFIDWLDGDQEKLTEFSSWLSKVITTTNFLKKN